MDDYLLTTMTKLKTKNYNKLNIIIGNESCDLDSAVSAITYGAFLHWQYNQIQCKVCTRMTRDKAVKDYIFVPILNVDREDYALKTEVAFCLSKHEISEANLVFRDDFTIKDLLTPNTSATLVDHHVLANRDQFLAPYVTEIIDHRPLDRSTWTYKDDVRSTIEVVGSCCTLVVQRMRDLGRLMSKELEFFKAFPNCGQMLYATIILDTVNFSKEVNKATPRDEETVLFLESVLDIADCQVERKNTLDCLVSARKDVTALTAAQLLRKDVKVAGDVLVPSFPTLVKVFLAKPGALQAVTEALSKNSCSIALLLGMELSGGLQRDTAICCPNDPDRSSQLAKCLEGWQNPALQLSSEVLPLAGCLYYKQMNLSASRKQYMPIVKQFLQQK